MRKGVRVLSSYCTANHFPPYHLFSIASLLVLRRQWRLMLMSCGESLQKESYLARNTEPDFKTSSSTAQRTIPLPTISSLFPSSSSFPATSTRLSQRAPLMWVEPSYTLTFLVIRTSRVPRIFLRGVFLIQSTGVSSMYEQIRWVPCVVGEVFQSRREVIAVIPIVLFIRFSGEGTLFTYLTERRLGSASASRRHRAH